MTRYAKLLWAAPCSLVGLCLALPILAFGATAHLVDGVVEVTFRDCGSVAPWLRFRAITFGHVVLATTREELRSMRPHESVHVTQYERWGLLFFPLYAGSSVWQLLRGKKAYWDNHFEAEARKKSGNAHVPNIYS